MFDKIHDVVILGSGPAGLTAAVYAARANLNPIVIDGSEPGGQLMITTDVENYPGFPKGILGPEMMQEFRAQAERFGTQIVEGAHCTDIDVEHRPFKLTLEMLYEGGFKEIQAKTVIIATGASAKWLGLESETLFRGFGVSACATCDGAFFRDLEVAVVGGGDTAMEEALFLTRHASKVYVIHRRDELRASKVMQQRAFRNEKIEFIWNTVVDEVLGETEPMKKVTGLRLKDSNSGETRDLAVNGLFLGIGHKPNTDIFRGKLDMDENGYLILSKPDTTYTKVPGVFAAGDVSDHVYRQAVTAAGMGCKAAIDAERWLEEQAAAEAEADEAVKA